MTTNTNQTRQHPDEAERDAIQAEPAVPKKTEIDLYDYQRCLARALATMPKVEPTGYNKQTRHNYATAEDILRVARPHLGRLGFVLTCSSISASPIDPRTTKEGDQVEGWSACVEARLIHLSGQSISALGYGAGYDPGDKGVLIAQSNARRVAIAGLLNPIEVPPKGNGGAQ